MREVKPEGPRIYRETLYRDDGESLLVGSAAWQAWLEEAATTEFTFRDGAGEWHHARREARRGRAYWYVACRVGGRVQRFYLGAAPALNVGRLVAVAEAIAAARAALTGRRPPPRPAGKEGRTSTPAGTG